jgi:hypothetical protein
MIFDSGQSYAGRAYQDAMSAAHARRIPIVLARRGMLWFSGDGATLDILALSLPFLSDTGDDVNENSIVVMLRANGFRELFMGCERTCAEQSRSPSSRQRQCYDALRADRGPGNSRFLYMQTKCAYTLRVCR